MSQQKTSQVLPFRFVSGRNDLQLEFKHMDHFSNHLLGNLVFLPEFLLAMKFIADQVLHDRLGGNCLGHLARAAKSIPVCKTFSISGWLFSSIFSRCTGAATLGSQVQSIPTCNTDSQIQRVPIFSSEVEEDGDGVTSRSAFSPLLTSIHGVLVQAL